jgi:FixJ family two-component response regulator
VVIHIIEDDPGVNEALRMLLQALGHTVIAHETAATLFSGPVPESADLVIVDLGLPDIDGMSVIRWLSNLSSPPRVVAITGQSQMHIDRALKGDTSIVVLRKPLSGDAVVSALD